MLNACRSLPIVTKILTLFQDYHKRLSPTEVLAQADGDGRQVGVLHGQDVCV